MTIYISVINHIFYLFQILVRHDFKKVLILKDLNEFKFYKFHIFLVFLNSTYENVDLFTLDISK